MAFITPNGEISSTALLLRCFPFLVLFPSLLWRCLTIVLLAWSLHESLATEAPQTRLLLEPKAKEENKTAVTFCPCSTNQRNEGEERGLKCFVWFVFFAVKMQRKEKKLGREGGEKARYLTLKVEEKVGKN